MYRTDGRRYRVKAGFQRIGFLESNAWLAQPVPVKGATGIQPILIRDFLAFKNVNKKKPAFAGFQN